MGIEEGKGEKGIRLERGIHYLLLSSHGHRNTNIMVERIPRYHAGIP